MGTPYMHRLNKKENIKINKIIQEKKVDYFLKCLKCSISSITSSGSLTEIVQNQLHTKRPTTDINFSRKTTPEKIKIKRDITTQTEIYKERKYTTTPDTLKHNTQIDDRNNTQVKKGNQTESDKIIWDRKNTTIIIDTETAQNTSKDNKSKQFIASNLASLPLVDPSIAETQVTTEKRTQINIVQKEQTATKNTKSYSENFIRIIDNIPRNILPKSSEDIKNRIKATTTKHIKTDFLYKRRHSLTLTFRRRYSKHRE